jgi:hypothetical protein
MKIFILRRLILIFLITVVPWFRVIDDGVWGLSSVLMICETTVESLSFARRLIFLRRVLLLSLRSSRQTFIVVEFVFIKYLFVRTMGYFISELFSSNSFKVNAYSHRCLLFIHSTIFDRYPSMINSLVLWWSLNDWDEFWQALHIELLTCNIQMTKMNFDKLYASSYYHHEIFEWLRWILSSSTHIELLAWNIWKINKLNAPNH